MRIMSRRHRENTQKGVLGQLLSMNNLTFFKDYQTRQGTLNADYSVGSPTATFTCDRTTSSPGTYVDGSGVIRLMDAVDDTPRYQGGYYDETGFHAGNKGLMVEAAGTNQATYSGTPSNAAWVKTTITETDADVGSSSPDGVATANSLLATAANGTFVQAYAITGAAATYTASCWIKRKTGTGVVNLGAVEDGTGKAAKTITTSWTRHSVTATTDGDDAGKDPAVYIELESDTDAIYIYGMQLELSPYATSFIPTTTAAMSRSAEVLTYPSTGNRTALTESILIKYSPFFSYAAGVATENSLFYSVVTGGNRNIRHASTGTLNRITYDAASAFNTTTAPAINTSSVVGMVFLGETASPNVIAYYDGTADGNTDTNYTAPTFGETFGVGGNTTTTSVLNGIVQSISIFSDAKSATDVLKITNAMNS